jgi:hypothetical protein
VHNCAGIELLPPKDEAEAKNPSGYGTSPYMKTVALSILVMGVSIAVVILLWIWFGYIGSSFSSHRLLDQQQELRQQYDLPPQPPVPASQLEVPPSERGLVGNASGNETSISSTNSSSTTNATSSASGSNATASTTNNSTNKTG